MTGWCVCVCMWVQRALKPRPLSLRNIPAFLIGCLGVDAVRETSRGQRVAQVSNRLRSPEGLIQRQTEILYFVRPQQCLRVKQKATYFVTFQLSLDAETLFGGAF